MQVIWQFAVGFKSPPHKHSYIITLRLPSLAGCHRLCGGSRKYVSTTRWFTASCWWRLIDLCFNAAAGSQMATVATSSYPRRRLMSSHIHIWKISAQIWFMRKEKARCLVQPGITFQDKVGVKNKQVNCLLHKLNLHTLMLFDLRFKKRVHHYLWLLEKLKKIFKNWEIRGILHIHRVMANWWASHAIYRASVAVIPPNSWIKVEFMCGVIYKTSYFYLSKCSQ